MTLIEATETLHIYMEKLNAAPAPVRDDDTVHNVLRAAAAILPRWRLLAAESVQEVMYTEYPQIGFTINSCYNETVAFLLENKPRCTPLACWATMMSTYMRDVAGTTEVEKNNSIGARLIAASFGRAGKVRDMGKSHQSTTIDKRLLSYADHELLALWMTRKDGFADMISTLAVFISITRP